MFSVVKFLGENSVSTVPSSWLSRKGSKCFWPPGLPATVSRAISSKKSPESSWTAHPIKFYKTADSLLAAKSLEKEAEKAETLDTTDPEEFSNIKRAATKTLQPRSKKVKKSRPPPPESSDDDESVEDDDEELDLVGFNGHVFSQAEVHVAQTDENLGAATSLQDVSDVSDAQEIATTTTSLPHHLENESLQNLIHPRPSLTPVSKFTSDKTRRVLFSDVRPRPKETFEELVLRLLTELKTNVAELLRRSKVVNPSKKVVEIPFSLPFREQREIDELELWILADEKNSLDLIEFLSQWGGETSAKVTRRILSELFDSTLGRQFNYTGGGTLNKRSFSALELHDKVVAATRQCEAAYNTEIVKIERVIQNYFRDTRDKKGPGARIRSRNVSKKKKSDTAGGSETSVADGNSK
ncbi:hypothetical protein Fcan01_10235 [Folsomia candida]|uniref:DUF4806 domain-containing protein n=1 Tax=Folsomia candida TaxID=158441 RepID=A0A226E8N2_FOLCA|nr:hypothetical protein Fcan01_10235 [Folsomia candida]